MQTNRFFFSFFKKRPCKSMSIVDLVLIVFRQFAYVLFYNLICLLSAGCKCCFLRILMPFLRLTGIIIAAGKHQLLHLFYVWFWFRTMNRKASGVPKRRANLLLPDVQGLFNQEKLYQIGKTRMD